MSSLELRDEFLTTHMRATAIELRNRQGDGWAQENRADELLRITYPTADVQRSLSAVSTAEAGKPIVFIGERGRGKSHLMAVLHHAFASSQSVETWAGNWGQRLNSPRLLGLSLQSGFLPISETLSNQEFPNLWDVIFDRHPNGQYYKGQFESSGSTVPAKSLLQDLFTQQRTALILDELQTWFDGLHDEPGDSGPKRRQWAFNFVQTLSELATERPDLLCLIASVRNSETDAYRQLHRVGPVLIDFKGETAKEDRKRLVLHRLFKNRENFADPEIEHVVNAYAGERVRLLYADKTDADKARYRQEVIDCWPFAPELLNLLEDSILMAAAAQDNRDVIRILAEVYRERGAQSPVVTSADFCIDDSRCGVTSLIDSFATSADQERLREKAQRNLEAIQVAGINAPNARSVISSLWMRSLSATQNLGGSRNEVQLDITRCAPVDDNAFTAELADIVENSFNIHEVGSPPEVRYCFRLPENPRAKLKANARNDRLFEAQTAAAPGLHAIRRDQEYLKSVVEYILKSPESTSEQPSGPIVLDPNWENAPWANVQQADQPQNWPQRGKPVLVVLPVAPRDASEVLGPWLVRNVAVNRNMVRFLVPKADAPDIYDDRDLLITARCALLAKEWKDAEPQYDSLHKHFERELKKELAERFDRYAFLDVWDYQTPTNCTFHLEFHSEKGGGIPAGVESHVSEHFFAPEDFEAKAVEAAQREDTVGQLLSLLQGEPLSGAQAIPYLGEVEIYDSLLQLTAADRVALNIDGTWHHREAAESEEDAFTRLRQRAWRTGNQLHQVQLGLPSQVGGPGVSATSLPEPQPTCRNGATPSTFPTATDEPPPITTDGDAPGTPVSPPPGGGRPRRRQPRRVPRSSANLREPRPASICSARSSAGLSPTNTPSPRPP